MKTFYNTTNEKGKQLEIFALKAENQDFVVFTEFQKNKKLPPSKCWSNIYINSNMDLSKFTPLTSVRRSITNLTKAGKLRKTNEKAIGIYGRPEYIWEII